MAFLKTPMLPPRLLANRRLIPLAISLMLALVAVFIMNQQMQRDRRKIAEERARLYKDYKAPQEVIVAMKDIPEGTVIAKEHLGIMQIPEKFLQPYSTRDPNLLIGKVTRSPIAEKEQVLVNKVRSPEERPKGSLLSDITPEGKRAVTIGVNALTGVGGFVRPGDKVDILWNVKLASGPAPGGKGSGEPATLTLFQDVTILAVNSQVMGRAPVPGQAAETPREALITVALSPNEASLLLFAREQGSIQLSLRPTRDAGQQVAAQPANIDALMQLVFGDQAAAPAPEVPASRTVELYRGLERNVVTVEAK